MCSSLRPVFEDAFFLKKKSSNLIFIWIPITDSWAAVYVVVLKCCSLDSVCVFIILYLCVLPNLIDIVKGLQNLTWNQLLLDYTSTSWPFMDVLLKKARTDYCN